MSCPVVVYGIVYSTVYFLLFLLETLIRKKTVAHLRSSAAAIARPAGAADPVFGTRRGDLYRIFRLLAFSIYLASLTLILLRPYWSTRTEHRLSRQIEELRSIAEMSKAISANLELGTLLDVVYNQVKTLLNVESSTGCALRWHKAPVSAQYARWRATACANLQA